jgi:hypothetical protein
MALRKKMRAKLCATTQEMPHALMAMGACSREEPQPKFVAATMMSPAETRVLKSGSMFSMQCSARREGSDTLRYLAGMIASVSTSAP